MFAALRQRLAQRWFGDGMSGAVALSLATWASGKLVEGIRHEPEVLDVSRLKPGETYTISTRPAPTSRERKLIRKTTAAQVRVAKATRSTRAQRRTARNLQRTLRKAARAKDGSPTRRKRVMRAELLEQRQATLSAHSARQQRLIDALNVLQAELQAEQDAHLAKARKKARPPRRRIWR